MVLFTPFPPNQEVAHVKPASTIALPRADTSRQPWLRRGLLFALLLLMVAAPALGGPKGSDTPRALAPLPGDTDSFAQDINNRGQVVGRSVGAVTTAVVWDPDGNATALLPLPGATSSFGEGINNRGQVVGRSSTNDPCPVDTAVVWDRHGVATPLAPLPGDVVSRAFAINSRGDVSGLSLGPLIAPPACAAAWTAVIWDKDGNPTALSPLTAPAPLGGFYESGTGFFGGGGGMNNRGAVVGVSINAAPVDPAGDFIFVGTLWDRQHNPNRLLADVGCVPVGGCEIQLTNGINNSGVVAGGGWDINTFAPYATVWDRDGNPTDLPPLSGDPDAEAFDINNRGAISGTSGTYPNFGVAGTAVVWDEHSVPNALPGLPGSASCFGAGINDPGHAVGRCVDAAGTATAVVWRSNVR